ncbi:MAG: hypothetical protein MK089_12110 [Phycisphaerales bacterium]|nr:hypothetical protein [Phycisphaerales bacterium]
MRFITDILYLVTVLLTSPIWFTRMVWRGRLRTDWRGRFGHAAHSSKEPCQRLLFHAVSVGEVNALRSLVLGLEEIEGLDVVIATTTDTGFKRATELYGSRHQIVRYPLDFSWAVGRFLQRIRPTAVALVELEVWPNFVAACLRGNVPIAVINGRLSERSYSRYRLLRFLLRPSFRRLSWVGCQTEEYAARFEGMGCEVDRIEVTGSMKWDNTALPLEGAEQLAIELGIDADKPLIVAGSTAPEEHKLLHEATPEGVQLLCAPRRPEWFEEASRVMVGCARRTQNKSGSETGRFLLDTIGELSHAYLLADLVVIGRSFGNRHGSDVSEPVGRGKPVVVGPAVADFQDMVDELVQAGGIIQCDRASLAGELKRLLDDEQARSEVAANGLKVLRIRQGASARTQSHLLQLMK